MIRTIDGFHADPLGDWVAELSCLHRQHVRHSPPFQERPWVLSEAGRNERIGTPIECTPCDRAEPPGDLMLKRTVGPFDSDTLPNGLKRDHRVGARTWALLRVLVGPVSFEMTTDAPLNVTLATGASQWIPPGVDHSVRVDHGSRIEVDFLGSA